MENKYPTSPSLSQLLIMTFLGGITRSKKRSATCRLPPDRTGGPAAAFPMSRKAFRVHESIANSRGSLPFSRWNPGNLVYLLGFLFDRSTQWSGNKENSAHAFVKLRPVSRIKTDDPM